MSDVLLLLMFCDRSLRCNGLQCVIVLVPDCNHTLLEAMSKKKMILLHYFDVLYLFNKCTYILSLWGVQYNLNN